MRIQISLLILSLVGHGAAQTAIANSSVRFEISYDGGRNWEETADTRKERYLTFDVGRRSSQVRVSEACERRLEDTMWMPKPETMVDGYAPLLRGTWDDPTGIPVTVVIDANRSFCSTDFLFGSGLEPLPPVTINMSASPEVVPVGNTVLIEWTIDNAIVCQPFLGGNTNWTDAKIALPRGLYEVESIDENTTFNIQCSNGVSNFTESVSVDSVAETYPGQGIFPAGCDASPATGTSWQVNPSTYEQLFGIWPGDFGSIGTTSIQANKWVALWFQTGEAATTGRIDTIPSMLPSGASLRTISIAECPGDFDPIDPDCVVDTAQLSSQIWWRVPADSTPGICGLEPSKDYYLNVIFSDRAALGHSLCNDNEAEQSASCPFQAVPRRPWD